MQVRLRERRIGRREKVPTMGEMSSRIAQRDFAKRFERGELRSRPADVRTTAARILPDDCSLQLRVLRLGFLQDGVDGVGVFPPPREYNLRV
jgi:hypothetical protein